MSELAYWKDRAALLDPLAYEYISGACNLVVPAGETWYTLNLWHAIAAGNFLFQRPCNADAPLMWPEGSTITLASSVPGAFAYICKPSLVFSDERYSIDPKALYYERINRLRSLTMYDLSLYISPGSGMGTYTRTSFPSDFQKGLIVHVSTHDAAWIALRTPSNNGMNTLNEVSDNHQMRFAEPIMLPFNRSVFDKLEMRAASTTGSGGSLEGRGVVKYFKLPSDW